MLFDLEDEQFGMMDEGLEFKQAARENNTMTFALSAGHQEQVDGFVSCNET